MSSYAQTECNRFGFDSPPADVVWLAGNEVNTDSD